MNKKKYRKNKKEKLKRFCSKTDYMKKLENFIGKDFR